MHSVISKQCPGPTCGCSGALHRVSRRNGCGGDSSQRRRWVAIDGRWWHHHDTMVEEAGGDVDTSGWSYRLRQRSLPADVHSERGRRILTGCACQWIAYARDGLQTMWGTSPSDLWPRHVSQGNHNSGESPLRHAVEEDGVQGGVGTTGKSHRPTPVEGAT